MQYSDTFLYGARSGMQKAVRRGDVSLIRTCFEALWGYPEHRKWMLWRIPILVVEDCWIMAGELAMTQETEKALEQGSVAHKAHWLKFLVRLAISVKAQDAAWIWYLARCEAAHPAEHREWELMRHIVLTVEDGDEKNYPSKFPRDRFNSMLREMVRSDLTPYEEKAFAMIEARRKTGGMVPDQWNCMAAALLLFTRGLPEESVLGMLEEQKAKYSGAKVGVLDELPWFCFDMHTRAGLKAGNVFRKNYGKELDFNKEFINGVWFQFTSARMGESVLGEVLSWRDVPAPTCLQTIWFTEKRTAVAREAGMTLPELEKYWYERGEPKMRDLIEWALSKE